MNSDNISKNQSAPNAQIPPSGLKIDDSKVSWRERDNIKPWLLADNDSGKGLQIEEENDVL